MIYIISLYRGGIEKFVRPTEYTGQAGQDSDRCSKTAMLGNPFRYLS